MAILHLKAKPDSRANQLLVGPDGAVTARLQAPAHDGRANAALQTPLAAFGLPKSSVTLLAGHAVPFKKVELAGLSAGEMAAVLAALAARWKERSAGPAAAPAAHHLPRFQR